LAAKSELVFAVGSVFLKRESTSLSRTFFFKTCLPGIFEVVQMIKKLFRFRLELFDVQMVNVELFSALGEHLLFLVSLGASSFSLV
jgi:hypothetical protein